MMGNTSEDTNSEGFVVLNERLDAISRVISTAHTLQRKQETKRVDYDQLESFEIAVAKFTDVANKLIESQLKLLGADQCDPESAFTRVSKAIL